MGRHIVQFLSTQQKSSRGWIVQCAEANEPGSRGESTRGWAS